MLLGNIPSSASASDVLAGVPTYAGGPTGTLNVSNINTALGNGHADATAGIIQLNQVIGDLTGTYNPTGGGDTEMNQAINATLTPNSISTFTLSSDFVLATDTLGSSLGFQFNAAACTVPTQVAMFVRYVASGSERSVGGEIIVQPGKTATFNVALPSPVYSVIIGCRCVGSIGSGAAIVDGLISGN